MAEKSKKNNLDDASTKKVKKETLKPASKTSKNDVSTENTKVLPKSKTASSSTSVSKQNTTETKSKSTVSNQSTKSISTEKKPDLKNTKTAAANNSFSSDKKAATSKVPLESSVKNTKPQPQKKEQTVVTSETLLAAPVEDKLESILKAGLTKVTKATDKKPKSTQKPSLQESQHEVEKPISVKAKIVSPVEDKKLSNKETELNKNKKSSTKETESKKESFIAKNNKDVESPSPFAETILTQPKENIVKYIDIIEKVESKIIFEELAKAPEYVQIISSTELKKPKFENIIGYDAINKALHEAGWNTPTALFQQVLPATLRGSDVMLYSKAEVSEAALISIIPSLAKLISGSAHRGKIASPNVIILTPNNFLAEKILQAALKVTSSLGIYADSLIEEEKSTEVLKNSIDIAITTPKMLLTLFSKNKISLSSLNLVAIHDLQQLLLTSSETDLTHILNPTATEKIQKIFISSENTPETREFSFLNLENPEFFNNLELSYKAIHQTAYALPAVKKFQVLLAHLKSTKPACAVVYANTRTVAEWIAFKLNCNKIKVELISHEPYLKKKEDLLKNIQLGNTKIIVTTDALAQTLGVISLTHLYHFDIPELPDLYTQRLRRLEKTNSGESIAFICEDYGYNVGAVENLLGFSIPLEEPKTAWLSFNDDSEYPLESDGRVKQFMSYAASLLKEKEAPLTTTQKPEAAPKETQHFDRKPAIHAQPKVEKEPQHQPLAKPEAINIPLFTEAAASPSPHHPVAAASTAPTLKPRVREAQPIPQRTQNAEEGMRHTKRPAATHPAQHSNKRDETSAPRYQSDKYVRRDERAHDIADSVRQAAKNVHEKRQDKDFISKKTPPKRPSFFQLASNVLKDVIQTTSNSAKESFISSLGKNLPKAAELLSKYAPTLAPKEDMNEDKE